MPTDPTHAQDLDTYLDPSELSQDARLYRHPILTRSQEQILARRIEKGDLEAKNLLITHNLRLARRVASGYAKHCEHLDVDDLTQYAVLGLTRAAEKFDYRRGYKFSTYATNWIKQSISRAIADYDANIRTPVHIDAAYRRLYAADSAYLKKHGTRPTDAQLAELAEADPNLIEQWRNRQRVTSLQTFVGDDDTELQALIPDPDTDTANEASSEILREEVAHLLTDLTDQQRQIVYLRFFDELTLKATATKMDLTLQEVRALEHAAVRQLKHLRE